MKGGPKIKRLVFGVWIAGSSGAIPVALKDLSINVLVKLDIHAPQNKRKKSALIIGEWF